MGRVRASNKKWKLALVFSDGPAKELGIKLYCGKKIMVERKQEEVVGRQKEFRQQCPKI